MKIIFALVWIAVGIYEWITEGFIESEAYLDLYIGLLLIRLHIAREGDTIKNIFMRLL